MEELDKVCTGQVLWFDPKKGYGFLKPDDGSADVFCHWQNIQMEGFKCLTPEQKVSFKLGANHKGKQAVEIKIL